MSTDLLTLTTSELSFLVAQASETSVLANDGPPSVPTDAVAVLDGLRARGIVERGGDGLTIAAAARPLLGLAVLAEGAVGVRVEAPGTSRQTTFAFTGDVGVEVARRPDDLIDVAPLEPGEIAARVLETLGLVGDAEIPATGALAQTDSPGETMPRLAYLDALDGSGEAPPAGSALAAAAAAMRAGAALRQVDFRDRSSSWSFLTLLGDGDQLIVIEGREDRPQVTVRQAARQAEAAALAARVVAFVGEAA